MCLQPLLPGWTAPPAPYSIHEQPGHDAEDCSRCNTRLILNAIHESRRETLASIQDIKDKLDKLTTQEAGETNLAPGQVAVAQSDIDAIDTHVASLIDAAPAPAPAPGPAPAPTPAADVAPAA